MLSKKKKKLTEGYGKKELTKKKKTKISFKHVHHIGQAKIIFPNFWNSF